MKKNIISRIFRIVNLETYDLTCPFMIGWWTWNGYWVTLPVNEVEKDDRLKFIYFKNIYKSVPFIIEQEIWMAF